MVIELPIRDGNFDLTKQNQHWFWVIELPIRDGNQDGEDWTAKRT